MATPKSYVNVSAAWKEVKELHVNVSAAWKKITQAYVNVSGVWKLVFNSTVEYSISSNASAVVLSSLVDPAESDLYTITIDAGVTLTGSSSAPALDIGSGWNAGVVITVINNGTIQGYSGSGSTNRGSSSNYCLNYTPATSDGGIGIKSTVPLVIINAGSINGGGGGGGCCSIYGYGDGGSGGAAISSTSTVDVSNSGWIRGGGGGGGGQENWGGSTTDYGYGVSASTHTGGNGGDHNYGYSGGAGGTAGNPGSTATPDGARNYNCGYGPGRGGAAGAAVTRSGGSTSGTTSQILGVY